MRELNTGWTEWSAAGLPTHSDPQLARGTITCSCSLHRDLLLASEAPGAQPDAPPAP